MGAKKSQLFKGLFAESGLLMAISLLFALVIASAGFSLLQLYLASELPRVNELSINVFTRASAFIIALLFALVFALLSSKMINYRALNSSLQSSGKGTGIQVSKRLRQSLIIVQVAIATTLVFANAALFKDSMGMITRDNGFNIEDTVQIGISVSAAELPPEEELTAAMDQMVANLSALPQVTEVANGPSVLSGFGIWALTSVSSQENFIPEAKSVSHNYFSMSGQTLLEGSYFSEAEVRDNNRVMIVNDVFAKRLNPNGSALGMQISNDSNQPSFTIVGIVQGVTLPGETDIPMRVYSTVPAGASQLTVKLAEGQTLTREQVVSSIRQVGSQYALFYINDLEALNKTMLFTQYTTAVTTAGLAIITLFLASIGLYGILSYGTQMRRFELGTRMAIGAKRSALVSLIIKDNLGVVLFGVLISILIMVVAYATNLDTLQTYMQIGLVPLFLATFLAIGVLSLFACYWLMRQFINRPAIHSLRGSD